MSLAEDGLRAIEIEAGLLTYPVREGEEPVRLRSKGDQDNVTHSMSAEITGACRHPVGGQTARSRESHTCDVYRKHVEGGIQPVHVQLGASMRGYRFCGECRSECGQR